MKKRKLYGRGSKENEKGRIHSYLHGDVSRADLTICGQVSIWPPPKGLRRGRVLVAILPGRRANRAAGEEQDVHIPQVYFRKEPYAREYTDTPADVWMGRPRGEKA